MFIDTQSKPARYRFAALRLCERVAGYVARRDYPRANRALRAARRLNQLAYRAA